MTTSFSWHKRDDLLRLALILAVGTCGGFIAAWVGLPLPFMMGSLIAVLGLSVLATRRGIGLVYPSMLRKFFIGMIGTMIGGTFTPEVLGLVPSLGISMAGVTVYVAVAHLGAYWICRRIGRYDPVTSFYGAMPGGLIEGVELGRRGGGDVPVLTMLHFLRVLSVVVLVPVFFWLTSGDVVGSAGGQSFDRGGSGITDVLLVVGITLVGLAVGRVTHIPAAHLLGPMLVSAVLHGTNIVETSTPVWLLFLSQLAVGAGLGTQFSGAGRGVFRGVLRTAVVMMVFMLSLSALFAWGLDQLTGLGWPALFLSLAPGGVTEMGLIALSLSLSPVVVATHHVFRIFLTVLVAAISTRFFVRQERA